MDSDILRNCSQLLVAQLGTVHVYCCVLVCWWVVSSSYCGPCAVRTAVIWTPGWCGHFGAKYSPICTIEFMITICYYHHYYYTLRYSISALRSFTVALSWFFSVTHTKEFPLHGPDSRVVRTSPLLPHPVLQNVVMNTRRYFVFLTLMFLWQHSGICLLYQ